MPYPFSAYTCRVSAQLRPADAPGLRVPDSAQSSTSSGNRVSMLTKTGAAGGTGRLLLSERTGRFWDASKSETNIRGRSHVKKESWFPPPECDERIGSSQTRLHPPRAAGWSCLRVKGMWSGHSRPSAPRPAHCRKPDGFQNKRTHEFVLLWGVSTRLQTVK